MVSVIDSNFIDKWQNHKDFLKTVAKMDIGMQFSLSETYNIVAGDFVYVGIPIVVSPEIQWMPWYSKADPYDINKMVKVLKRNYELGNVFSGKFTRWLNRKYLARDNDNAGKIWLEYLLK